MSWRKHSAEICALTRKVSESVRTEHFVQENKELHQSLFEVIDPYSVRRNEVTKLLQGIKFDQVVKYFKHFSSKEVETHDDVFLLWICCALLPKLGSDRDALFLHTMNSLASHVCALKQFSLF